MDKKEKPVIRVLNDGPFIVENLDVLRNSKGVFIETGSVISLCRCGESENKPFCDGKHLHTGFSGSRDKKYPPEKITSYEGKYITVHDVRGACSHIGHCILMLPQVFRKGKIPWVDPDAADPDEIAKVIRTCPSGALSYTFKDKHYRDYPHEPEIFMVKNGPYHVIGGIKLEDPDGIKPVTEDHYSLCRCGKSKKKPLCDGTHRNTEFKDRIN